MKSKINKIKIHNKQFVGIFLVAIIACISNGCKKFVQVPEPISQLVTSEVFNNSATANAAQLAIYNQMVNNLESYNVALSNGLLSDELINYSPYSQHLAYYLDDMSTTTNNYGCWSPAYNYIYEANAIIAELQNNHAIPTSVINHLQGESYFIRAFWYFYLVNEFGDVPLVTSTDYSINANLSRTSKAQVYQQMVSDLSTAENLLSNNYVDATDTTMTNERARPNSAAASALLARVYLFMGDHYGDAAKEASKVIANPLYQLVAPLTQTNYAFTANNSEAIWQLAQIIPLQDNGATEDGQLYILQSKPGNVALSSRFVSSFEPGDLRRKVWVGTYTADDGTIYYYPWKYKMNYNNGDPNNPEYNTVLRLAEQYLIRAEAEAQQGDLTAAANDLNVIRTRAGLPNTNAATQTDMLAAILHERKFELFCEWGHRWFDLIRTGNVNSVMGSPGNECQAKGGTWHPNDALYPIPLPDIIADHNLKQNPGY